MLKTPITTCLLSNAIYFPKLLCIVNKAPRCSLLFHQFKNNGLSSNGCAESKKLDWQFSAKKKESRHFIQSWHVLKHRDVFTFCIKSTEAKDLDCLHAAKTLAQSDLFHQVNN